MTLTELITRLDDATNVWGIQSRTSTAEKNVFLGECMRAFCEQVRPFFSDRIVFTPTASTAVYDYGTASAAFTSPLVASSQVALIEIRQVMLEGKYLEDFRYVAGLANLQDMVLAYPDYLNATAYPAGTVKKAWVQGDSLVLWPAPNAAAFDGGNNFITAYHHHPEIVSNSSTSTVIYLQPELLEDFVKFATYRMLEDFATGEQRDALERKKADNEQKLMAWRAKYKAKHRTPNRRGRESGVRHIF